MSAADSSEYCPLAATLAARVRANRSVLTRRWLERIAARVSIEPDRIFPTDALLDHVPLLMDGIASYLENPAREITAEVTVVAKARELGELRHAQGFDAYQILKEYELLGSILFSFLVEEVDELDLQSPRGELLICAQRLFRAVAIIQQSTLTHFLDLANERVHERDQRLRAFNRALSHEMKNRIGAVLGAGDLLLTLDQLGPDERARFAKIIVRNARDMQETLANLLDLSRLDGDVRQQRHIELPQAAAEVLRRLRDAADASKVEVRVEGQLPAIEVNAAAVELVLTNYVSNGIKYADPAKAHRFVTISGHVRELDDGCALVISVRDNGLGVPEEARERLFERFFRAHDTVTGVEGTGLGLNIVRETVANMGGRAWAEFFDEGSAFCFSIPCRRTDDSVTAGTEEAIAEGTARPSL